MRLVLPLVVLMAACRAPSGTSDAAPPGSAAVVEPHVPSAPGSGATAQASAPPSNGGEPAAPAPARPVVLRKGGEPRPMYQRANLTAAQIAKIFARQPELARIGPDVQLFDSGDGSYLSRSSAPREGVTFTTAPLYYTPEPGNELLVVVGRNKSMSFVVALSVLGGGGRGERSSPVGGGAGGENPPLDETEYQVASYFYMLNEIAPVALAYKPGQRPLSWTTCWMCPGEQGTVSVRDDHHVVIVQQ